MNYFVEYLLNSHFPKTSWFIRVKIFNIYFIVPVKKYLMVQLYIVDKLSSNRTFLARRC